MGLLDDLLGPIRDIASVKNEVTQSFSDVKDSLTEAKDQVTGSLSEVGDAMKQPLDGSIDAPETPQNDKQKQE